MSASVASSSAGALNERSEYFAVLSYSLNFVFGAGVLSIPYCFVHGGILASAITLFLPSFFTLISARWLFEVQARAMNLRDRKPITDLRNDMCEQLSHEYDALQLQRGSIAPTSSQDQNQNNDINGKKDNYLSGFFNMTSVNRRPSQTSTPLTTATRSQANNPNSNLTPFGTRSMPSQSILSRHNSGGNGRIDENLFESVKNPRIVVKPLDEVRDVNDAQTPTPQQLAYPRRLEVPFLPPLPPISILESMKVLQLTDLCQEFLGKNGKLAFDIALVVYAVSSTWVYASIFSMSVQRFVDITIKSKHAGDLKCDISAENGFLFRLLSENPRCYSEYLVILFMFYLMQLYILTLPMRALNNVQKRLTTAGVSAIFIILVWCFALVVIKFFRGTLPELDSTEVYLNKNEFGQVFNSFAFAQMIQTGVPMLTEISRAPNKISAFFAVKDTIILTTALYTGLGILAALAFGSDIEKVISLNWARRPYTVDDLPSFVSDDFAKVILICLDGIRYCLLLFPCVTVSSAFPLYIFALGDNFRTESKTPSQDNMKSGSAAKKVRVMSYAGSAKGSRDDLSLALENNTSSTNNVTANSDLDEPLLGRQESYIDEAQSFDTDTNNTDHLSSSMVTSSTSESKKGELIYFAKISAIPICLAALMADLTYILIPIGLAAFAIAFFIPSLLQLTSIQRCEREWGSSVESLYDTGFSNKWFVYSTILFGMFACIFSTTSVVLNLLKPVGLAFVHP